MKEGAVGNHGPFLRLGQQAQRQRKTASNFSELLAVFSSVRGQQFYGTVEKQSKPP
jgi:hypothetical protein